jgi:hypothetical protein
MSQADAVKLRGGADQKPYGMLANLSYDRRKPSLRLPISYWLKCSGALSWATCPELIYCWRKQSRCKNAQW